MGMTSKAPFVWRGSWDEFNEQVRNAWNGREGQPVTAHIGHPDPVTAPRPAAPPGTEAAATRTPGRAAHGAFWDAVGPELAGQPRDWTWETSTLRDHWEAAAQAVLSQAFPGLKRERDDARRERDEARDMLRRQQQVDAAAYRAEVDRITRERDEARQQLAAMKRVLAETSREVSAASADRDAIQAERDQLHGELTAARAALGTANADLATVRAWWNAEREQRLSYELTLRDIATFTGTSGAKARAALGDGG